MKHVFMIFSLILYACSVQKIRIQNTHINWDSPSYTKWNHFFLSGIGKQESKVIIDEKYCPNSSVSGIMFRKNFFNGLLTFLTFGIYTPRETAIYCNMENLNESSNIIKK